MKFTRILFNIVCVSFDVDFHKMTICRQEENAFEKESVLIVVNIIVERVNPSPLQLVQTFVSGDQFFWSFTNIKNKIFLSYFFRICK